jgi:hypothetical protein
MKSPSNGPRDALPTRTSELSQVTLIILVICIICVTAFGFIYQVHARAIVVYGIGYPPPRPPPVSYALDFAHTATPSVTFVKDMITATLFDMYGAGNYNLVDFNTDESKITFRVLAGVYPRKDDIDEQLEDAVGMRRNGSSSPVPAGDGDGDTPVVDGWSSPDADGLDIRCTRVLQRR